jgi:hypothetical protein
LAEKIQLLELEDCTVQICSQLSFPQLKVKVAANYLKAFLKIKLEK